MTFLIYFLIIARNNNYKENESGFAAYIGTFTCFEHPACVIGVYTSITHLLVLCVYELLITSLSRTIYI